jgi:hypothetical protein
MKFWPNGSWGNLPNLRGVRWTKHGDNDGLTVWCNSDGDWSVSQTITDHSFFGNQYRTLVEFGHVRDNDPASFVEYSTEWGPDILSQRGCGVEGANSGSGDPSIRSHFAEINSVRVTLQELPLYWGT